MQPQRRQQDLAGGVTQDGQIVALDGHSIPQKNYFAKQAATACGSMANQAPASRSRRSPFCPSGRTIRSDGTAVILTIAASAEAAAIMACRVSHHGGNTTATISEPGPACNVSAVIAIKLASSNAAAFSQAGHRDVEMVVPRSIQDNSRREANQP
jgi:hypothetical protein